MRRRARWAVAATVGLACRGSPAIASAHGIELIAGPIALSGVVVGVAGGLACALLRLNLQRALLILASTYSGVFLWNRRAVAVAVFLAHAVFWTAYVFAEHAPGQDPLSLSSLPLLLAGVAVTGGVPLLVGFATSVRIIKWLLPLERG
jgi:hypothetical protein